MFKQSNVPYKVVLTVQSAALTSFKKQATRYCNMSEEDGKLIQMAAEDTPVFDEQEQEAGSDVSWR